LFARSVIGLDSISFTAQTGEAAVVINTILLTTRWLLNALVDVYRTQSRQCL